MRLLVASGNKKKLAELRSIAEPLGIDVVSPDAVGGLDEVEETGSTFEENAALKARAAFDKTGIPAFADDSGLEVEALGWRPGVLSARYAGLDATDADRVRKLLGELNGVANRRARFVCVIAIAEGSGVVKTFRGEVNGRIIDTPRGSSGFGYDPVFVPDGHERTFAELPSEVKNGMSHRGNALRAALPELRRLAEREA